MSHLEIRMMTGGTPISGNHHMIMLTLFTEPQSLLDHIPASIPAWTLRDSSLRWWVLQDSQCPGPCRLVSVNATCEVIHSIWNDEMTRCFVGSWTFCEIQRSYFSHIFTQFGETLRLFWVVFLNFPVRKTGWHDRAQVRVEGFMCMTNTTQGSSLFLVSTAWKGSCNCLCKAHVEGERYWNFGKESESLLVGGLEHQFYFPIYWECHHPNWLSYFSEGWPNHQPAFFTSLKMKSWILLEDTDCRETSIQAWDDTYQTLPGLGLLASNSFE